MVADRSGAVFIDGFWDACSVEEFVDCGVDVSVTIGAST
jgi:hypothetical protein